MFHGRPLVEETTYTYDEQGRVVKSRTVRQSEWLKSDRTLAQAYDAYERSLCSRCGQPKGRAWHPHMANRYAADAIECHSCTAMDDWMRQHREFTPNDDRALMVFPIDQGPADLPPDPELH